MADNPSVRNRRRPPLWVLGALATCAAVVLWFASRSAKTPADVTREQAVVAWADGATRGHDVQALERLVARALTFPANRQDETLFRAYADLIRRRAIADERQLQNQTRQQSDDSARATAEAYAQQAADAERLGDLVSAERQWDKALRMQPGQPAFERGLERVQAILRSGGEAANARAALRARDEADRLRTAITAYLDTAQPDLEQATEQMRQLTEWEARAEALPGVVERLREVERLRARLNQLSVDHAATVAAEKWWQLAQHLAAVAQSSATSADWIGALQSGQHALTQLPSGESVQRQRIQSDYDRWVLLAAQSQAHRDQRERRDLFAHAVNRAELALANGDGNGALALVQQAVAFLADADAAGRERTLTLRDHALQRVRQQAEDAVIEQRCNLGEQAFAQLSASASPSSITALMAQADGDRGDGGDEHMSQRSAALQMEIDAIWELLQAAPQRPVAMEVAALQAELVYQRMRRAFSRGDHDAEGYFAAQLRRVDRAGRYGDAIEGYGYVLVSGGFPECASGWTLAPITIDGEARWRVDMAPAATAPANAIALTRDQPLRVRAGRWNLAQPAFAARLALLVAPGATTVLRVPARQPLIPGHALAYVPKPDGAIGCWLGQREVTNRQWAEYLTERNGGVPPATAATVVADAPAVRMTHVQAVEFCRWLGRGHGLAVRLPTVAESTFAAGAGDAARIYPWGRYFSASAAISAWVAPIAQPVTTAGADVGPFGHNHLAGNVREWCVSDDAVLQSLRGSWVPVHGGSWRDAAARCFRSDAYDLIERERAETWIGLRIAIDAP